MVVFLLTLVGFLAIVSFADVLGSLISWFPGWMLPLAVTWLFYLDIAVS